MVKTNKIVFEPNPYFRDPDKPWFSRVEYRGGGTPTEAARQVLQDGSVDFAFSVGNLAPSDLDKLQENGKGQLLTLFGASVERISLNRTDPNKETSDGERSSLQNPHPILSDKRVRHAIAMGIDRNKIAALYGTQGRPARNNLMAPPQYNSPQTLYDYNPDKAKSLLDEAGWQDTNGDGIREKGGVRLKLVYQGKVSALVNQTQQVVQQQLGAIGIDVLIKATDSSIMFGDGTKNPDADVRFNGDMLEENFASPSPDPSTYMNYWTCSQIPQKANSWAGYNNERWCNKDYDALLTQANNELDPAKRTQEFIQMNDMLIDDVVMIPIVSLASVYGSSKSLTDVQLTPWDYATWNIQDWRRVSQ
jgi:peptide/nickel transport system substrate-binding protein